MSPNESIQQAIEDQIDLVNNLCKSPKQLLEEVNNPSGGSKLHLMHMCIGMQTEVGELGDCIKKHAIYNQELDQENLIEEAGDLLFYLFGVLTEFDISLEEVLYANQVKLQERYAGKYTDEKAQARADKSEVFTERELEILERTNPLAD